MNAVSRNSGSTLSVQKLQNVRSNSVGSPRRCSVSEQAASVRRSLAAGKQGVRMNAFLTVKLVHEFNK